MYHMHIWKKWITPCPGPWGCCSYCSPGPSIWPLSPLKLLNLDSPWKSSLWTCIMCLGFECKKYDRLLSGKNHVLVELCLLWVDAVHHEARSEPRPFDIMSATTKKDFRKRSHVDSIIFTEIRAKKTEGGAYLPPPALNRVNMVHDKTSPVLHRDQASCNWHCGLAWGTKMCHIEPLLSQDGGVLN